MEIGPCETSSFIAKTDQMCLLSQFIYKMEFGPISKFSMD